MPLRDHTKRRVTGEVIHGDMLKILPSLGDNELFDFCFMDPPFNIGHEYPGYVDIVPEVDFQANVSRWIDAAWNALTPNGVLALHGNDQLCEMYLRCARQKGMVRAGWLVWHFRFGQHNHHNWINAHAHCLIYAKSKDYTFNAEAVKVDSDRATVYDDPRTLETTTPGRRLPLTVWGVPSDGLYWGRVQGNNKERCGNRPNQLPEVYLERLILAYTNPGDRVLDPMSGSGTASVVARALDRDYLAIDVDLDAIKTVKARLKKGAVRVE